jgi:hypothetical protein
MLVKKIGKWLMRAGVVSALLRAATEGRRETKRSRGLLSHSKQRKGRGGIGRLGGLVIGLGLGALVIYLLDQNRERLDREAEEQAEKAYKAGERLARSMAQIKTAEVGENGRVASSPESFAASETQERSTQTVEQMISELTAGIENEPIEREDAARISNGMKVVAIDGVDIGRVKEVEDGSFILSRPQGSDLRVPLDAFYKLEGTIVYLRFEANQIIRQGWEAVET